MYCAELYEEMGVRGLDAVMAEVAGFPLFFVCVVKMTTLTT
jgi:hypothetical protein